MAKPHGFRAATNPAANAKPISSWFTRSGGYASAATRSDSSPKGIAAVGLFTKVDDPSER